MEIVSDINQHLSSWTHFIEELTSYQTPYKTAKEVTADGRVDLIPLASYKLMEGCRGHRPMDNVNGLHGLQSGSDRAG
jgi:hypothetical protein